MNLVVQEPLVSVITPAYNASEYIADCINSVLSQSYPAIEHIIVDDGSQDDTVSICNAYAKEESSIQVVRHPCGKNLGVGASRELAVKMAEGEFIAFLDADDIFLPQKISQQVKAFQDYSEVILIHTAVKGLSLNARLTSEFEKWMNFSSTQHAYRLLDQPYSFKNNRITNSTVMVRRSEMIKVTFPILKYQYEDWFMWMIMSQYGLYLFLPDITTIYRIHDTSFTYRSRTSSLFRHSARLEFFLSLGKHKSYLAGHLSTVKFFQLIIIELYQCIKCLIKQR